MARVSIVTDSSACLGPSWGEALPVRVLPIAIHMPDGDLLDGDPAAPGTVYEQLNREEAVKSSPPSPLDYLAATEETDADAAVIITPASEFTVMYRHAQAAAGVARVPVAVVDSRTAAAAQGLVVLTACEAASGGASVEEVVSAAEAAARRAELVAVLGGVEVLRRSGHVEPVLLDVSTGVGVQPIFRLKAGGVQRLGVSRSRDAALRRVKTEAEDLGLTDAARSMVFHASARDRAEQLVALLGGTDDVTEFSPSMGIHTGPGVVGVAWLGRT
jgi:fatty acid kinase fatty acid binding subunit